MSNQLTVEAIRTKHLPSEREEDLQCIWLIYAKNLSNYCVLVKSRESEKQLMT